MIIYIRASLIAQFVKIPPKMQKTPIRFLGWEGAGEGTGYPIQYSWASLVAQLVKNPPAMWETWVQSLGYEHPLRRARLPTPVFWPREFHGLYSSWGGKESDTTERLSLHFNLGLPDHSLLLSLSVSSLVMGAVFLNDNLFTEALPPFLEDITNPICLPPKRDFYF